MHRDPICSIQVVIKQIDDDGQTGRVTITFNSLGIKQRTEDATKTALRLKHEE